MTMVNEAQSDIYDAKIVNIVDCATIENIHQAYQTILSEYNSGVSICIDVYDLSDVDLTFLQILESARRTARADGVVLSLSAPAAGVVLETLQRGGFLEDPQSRAFWLCEGGGG